MSQGKWAVDSRSLGIGIAIGLVLSAIIGAVVSLFITSKRRTKGKNYSKPYRSQTKSRTTVNALSFSAASNKFTSSKTKHTPTAGRLSLDTHFVAAHERSPSSELVLDIAPRKAREPSPSTRKYSPRHLYLPTSHFSHTIPASTQLEPQSQFDVDLEEMRATNTFSGLPTSSNEPSSSTHQRPTSSPTDITLVDPFGVNLKSQARHKRLSELESNGPKTSSSSTSLTSASEVVRRVQSDDYMETPMMREELYPRPRPSKLELELEAQQQWERPRGMGHTLPRPQTAKTVSSRPGTGGYVPPQTPGGATPVTGMASSSSFTPFSSDSSLGLPLLNGNTSSPTTSGDNSNSRPNSHYPPQTSLPNSKEAELSIDTSNLFTSRQPNEHKQRRKRDKGSESSLGLSRPSAALTQDSYSLPNRGLESSHLSNSQTHINSPSHQNEHQSSLLRHSRSRPLPQHPQQPSQSQFTINQYDHERDIAPPPYNIANVHSGRSDPDPEMLMRMRERSDSRSGEMGFGQSHHARNHLL